MRYILICLLFLPVLLSAQINESDTLNLKANLSLTGLWQGGNVQTLIFRAKSELSFKPFKKWVFKTNNSYVYQEFGKQKADEDFLSLNFLYLNPDRKIYPLALGFASTNFRRAIDVRYLFGAGVTFKMIEEKYHWLKFSVTTEYEHTEFNQQDFNRNEYDGNETINTWRATIWVNGKYHLFKNKVILTHESYFQPSLEKSNNFRWRGDIALEFPVWEFLSFKINYLHSYESIVIESQLQEDRFFTLGFNLKTVPKKKK